MEAGKKFAFAYAAGQFRKAHKFCSQIQFLGQQPAPLTVLLFSFDSETPADKTILSTRGHPVSMVTLTFMDSF